MTNAPRTPLLKRLSIAKARRPIPSLLGCLALLAFGGVALTLVAPKGLRADDAAPAAASDAVQQAIAKVQQLGGTVSQIAANATEREVTFHLSDQPIGDEALAVLPEIPEIVWLNLRGTKITDQGLAHVAKLSKLRRLHLEKTGITDAGLAHLQGLAELEYLNLYGTGVTDQGLASLAALTKLKKLYLWQSKATDAGAKQLIDKIAGLQVNLGAELKPVEIKPPVEPIAKGQFVRIRRTGTGQVLSLAEVEVISTEEAKALHREGKASQSSTAEGAAAERAIDGNGEPDFAKGSVTQTESQNYPWWLVDLGGIKPIASIKVHSRGDAVGSVIGSVVEILDADKQVIWSVDIKEGTNGQVFEFPAPAAK